MIVLRRNGELTPPDSWPKKKRLKRSARSSTPWSLVCLRAERKPVSADNPFLQWEKFCFDTMARSLDAFRGWRDALQEQTFFAIYGNPWLQALLGLKASDAPARPHPGIEQAYLEYVAERIEELRAGIKKGGPNEVAIRALIYVRAPAGAVDERGFEMLRRIHIEHANEMTLPPLPILPSLELRFPATE